MIRDEPCGTRRRPHVFRLSPLLGRRVCMRCNKLEDG